MSALKSRTKLVVGRVAAMVFPALTRQVRAGDVTGPKRRLKTLIAKAELSRLQDRGDSATIEQALTRRWTAENLPADYYDAFADRFERMFTGPHAPMVDWLKDFAPRAGVHHVIEIGCGDGQALAALAKRLPNIARWTGVDINAEIIARNQQTYGAHKALKFVAADAVDWLEAHVEPGALLMTYGGVMEYITPETLTKWFTLVAAKGGAGVLLTEPLDPDHDLAADPASHLWGTESSYSHNHRALLEAAGFTVLQSSEATSEGYRTIMMLAAPRA